ncbi:hypothetical protein ONZ43_g6314 [Nemania bipapillata]|uniref:Uncharacterized protein n=1 Tax=Nemania bipapillata TaxID=110536 RepID=A0ACC2I1I8_9PEZI|nr:hypothetical protein ONZ43_g6314 [Nemania bipapillata]
MWNDEEDNNPYGTSFDRRDSITSSSANPASPGSRDYQQRFETPNTPSSTSEDAAPPLTYGRQPSDVESDDEFNQPSPRRKPGGYDSRIEQILYENPELPILITDAGKSMESGGKYIVYTIRTGDLEVRRRYSEFASLRDALTKLHPTLVIPPIPEKHTMADYAANPTNAKQDQQIIDLRKRMLAVFLNRCRRMDQVLRRFPPEARDLSEHDLDPYFIAFESSIKELENALMGPMEKVNRRTLSHLSALATDLSDLGAKFNAFALSEPSASLAAAIERVGQAADSSYIATEELSSSLGANFAEPMRENAQFAGVVRSVLRYRVLKRVQQEMTNDDLVKKKALLEQLESSEAEARRIEYYLSSSQQIGGTHHVQPPRRSSSMKETSSHYKEGSGEDTASIDSDFPPSHGDMSSAPSARVGAPERSVASPTHRKVASGNSITNKIFGPIRHAIQGVADVDPERTRRDTIGKTRESIEQLEQAQVAIAHDVRTASASILQDLKRFQNEKEDDLKRYMLAYAKSQIEWAKKNKETWEEAKAEIEKIDET